MLDFLGKGKKDADCLRLALKEYNLEFSTILNDPDLASFRALPEFKELQEEARLGGEDIGYSFRRDLKLSAKSGHHFGGLEDSFTWHSQQQLAFLSSLQYQGIFEHSVAERVPLISWKLWVMQG